MKAEMSAARQGLAGVLVALLSSIVVLGSLALTLSERGLPVGMAPAITAAESILSPTRPPVTLSPGAPTFTPLPSSSPTPSPTLPVSSACPPLPGWIGIIVQLDDTLESLAVRYGTTTEVLQQGNCLPVDSLHAGSILYVPPPPFTATPTAVPTQAASPSPVPAQPTATQRPANTTIACVHPSGWVYYRVRSGDTLSSIGRLFGVTAYELQRANCMGSSTLIRTGQLLYVPNVPMRTPTFTASPQPTRTPVPTSTQTSSPLPTNTATPTHVAPTATGTIPATSTPVPSDPTPTLPPLPLTPPPIVTPPQPNSLLTGDEIWSDWSAALLGRALLGIALFVEFIRQLS